MMPPYFYSYSEIEQISFNGFNFTIPEETLAIISSLAVKVGSPAYVKTPVFQKREPILSQGSAPPPPIRKRRNKESADWDLPSPPMQSTASVLAQKEGISADINQIRVCLNKVSESTYNDVLAQLKTILTASIETANEEEMHKISESIFEIVSNNKFFSRLYANIYTELLRSFPPLNAIFVASYDSHLSLFKNVEYVDPDTDYNKFCANNVINEKRKAVSAFFVNLAINGTIPNENVENLLKELIESVLTQMVQPNKSNEVCELIENIAILFNKSAPPQITISHGGTQHTVAEIIRVLAMTKMKTYPSLSSKSTFKCMDLI
jgi:hypothetical protein